MCARHRQVLGTQPRSWLLPSGDLQPHILLGKRQRRGDCAVGTGKTSVLDPAQEGFVGRRESVCELTEKQAAGLSCKRQMNCAWGGDGEGPPGGW